MRSLLKWCKARLPLLVLAAGMPLAFALKCEPDGGLSLAIGDGPDGHYDDYYGGGCFYNDCYTGGGYYDDYYYDDGYYDDYYYYEY